MVYAIQNVFFYKRLQCSIQFAAGFVEKLRQLFFSVNMSKSPIIASKFFHSVDSTHLITCFQSILYTLIK